MQPIYQRHIPPCRFVPSSATQLKKQPTPYSLLLIKYYNDYYNFTSILFGLIPPRNEKGPQFVKQQSSDIVCVCVWGRRGILRPAVISIWKWHAVVNRTDLGVPGTATVLRFCSGASKHGSKLL